MKFAVLLSSLFLGQQLVVGQEGFLLMAQAVVRHGDKVPDAIDPLTAHLWEEFGISGQLTELGILQMLNLGKVFNEVFVQDDPLLPETFDQNLLHTRATSIGTARTLVSAEAMLEGLYPGAPVPVYTVAAERETLLRPDQNCPSYVAEFPRIKNLVGQQFATNFTELLTGIRQYTGFENQSPWDLVWNTREKVEAEQHHGFEIHPFFTANEELIERLGEYAAEQIYKMNGPADQRGPIGGELARTLVENIRAAQTGTSDVKFYLYSAHGGTLQILWQQLGLGAIPEVIGATFALELRVNNGEFILNAVWHQPMADGVTYERRVQQIPCPTLSDVCDVEDFADYILSRNHEDGCCFVGPGFFDLGCADYLNPDTRDIPECRLYRTWCPEVSCGDGQVVDRATLHCVRVSEKGV